MKFKKIMTVLVSFVALNAMAQDEEDDLLSLYGEEELVSIATGTAKQARFAPAVATVITQQDIQRIGARTLDEALEMVPGLHVSASFNRQDAVYSIRGIHTGQNPQVLLLIDGVRMQQTFSGARPYNYELSTNNIERIEIIRGPGSAVYGADAFAGVISVTTKSASGIENSTIGGRAGSFQRREAWLQTSDDWAGVKVSFAIDYATVEGDGDRIINADAQSQQLVTTNASASLAPGAVESHIEHWNARINFAANSWDLAIFSWNLVDAGLGTGGAQALDTVGGDESDYYGMQFKTKPFEIKPLLTIEAHVDTWVYDLDPTFVLYPAGTVFLGFTFPDGVIGNPSGLERGYVGELIANYDGWNNHSVRVGSGFQYNDFTAKEVKNFAANNFFINDFTVLTDVSGTPEAFIQDVSREQYYFYVQDDWSIANDWQATLGLRYDKFTQFGDTFNPRAALVWATNYNLTTKLLYGRAFRAPSFSELYTKNNPSLIGNENLEPEIIDTYEIAFDYRPSYALGVKLNLFYYEIDDLVEIKFGVAASNAVEQSGRGFEVEFDWDITEALSVIGNYAWQDAENDATGEDIASAPQQQLYLSSHLAINQDVSFSTVLNWVADRERPAADPRGAIDDYVTVDAVLRHRNAFDALDVSLSLKNIFDEDVREPSVAGVIPTMPEIPDDYPMEGRSINIELSYALD